jgi:hypothetical protein
MLKGVEIAQEITEPGLNEANTNALLALRNLVNLFTAGEEGGGLMYAHYEQIIPFYRTWCRDLGIACRKHLR